MFGPPRRYAATTPLSEVIDLIVGPGGAIVMLLAAIIYFIHPKNDKNEGHYRQILGFLAILIFLVRSSYSAYYLDVRVFDLELLLAVMFAGALIALPLLCIGAYLGKQLRDEFVKRYADVVIPDNFARLLPRLQELSIVLSLVAFSFSVTVGVLVSTLSAALMGFSDNLNGNSLVLIFGKALLLALLLTLMLGDMQASLSHLATSAHS